MIVNVNWQYIILNGSPSTGFRVARRTGGPPPVVDGGTDTPNSNNWSRTAPPSIHYIPDGRDYVFAFWSLNAQEMLSGQGSAQILGSNNANESFNGGAWTITARAYYVWNFGVGGGDNAILIDAFDIQAGQFIPDDFVDVTPDLGGALTLAANNGYIDTTTQITQGNPITVIARDTLVAKQFGYWQSVLSLQFANNPSAPPTVGSPNSHDIVVHYNDIVVAFAFYNEVRTTIQLPREPGLYNPWWWIETHGGLVPPGPPPPWMEQYMAGFALANVAGGVSPRLRAEVLELALRQISIASAGVKKDIGALMRGGKK